EGKTSDQRSVFHARLQPRLSIFYADQELDLLPALFADLLGFLQQEFLEFLAGEPVHGLAGTVQSLTKRAIELIHLAGLAFQIGTSDGYRGRGFCAVGPG